MLREINRGFYGILWNSTLSARRSFTRLTCWITFLLIVLGTEVWIRGRLRYIDSQEAKLNERKR
jgi:hypothetical protein